MSVIAVDLGATKVAAALFDQAGTPAHKQISHIEQRGGDDVARLVTDAVLALQAAAEGEGSRVDAVGVCVPGISYARTGRVWAPNIRGWDDYPLMNALRAAVPSDGIPVFIDSDRACAILGEVWQGAARGCRDAIFLAVGTGIGAGILVDGRILRGAHDIAGAIGWLALDRPFEQKYVSCGCFEYHASGEGLAKVAREYIARAGRADGVANAAADPEPGNMAENMSGGETRNTSSGMAQDSVTDGATGAAKGAANGIASAPAGRGLARTDPSGITAREVFEAADAGDPVAQRVIAEGIEFWGMATANLVSLFNPEKIIFGGGVFGPALRHLDAIMREARKWAQPVSINHVTLQGSRLGADAVLYGAAFLALRNSSTDYEKED